LEHKPEYLSNLTPLRGIAALLVAFYHFEMAIGRFIPAKTTMFFEKGYLMVDLFFLMSGFIILHVYKEDFADRIEKSSVKKYIVARFARIYPLHFFALLLLVILVILFSPPGTWPNPIESPWAIPTNFLLLHSFYIHDIYTWNVASWSISAEWAAYLVFPFVALFMNKKKILAPVVLVLFVIAAYLSVMYFLPRKSLLYPNIPVPHTLNATYDYGFLRGIAGFITGMMLYKLYQKPSIKKIFRKDAFSVLTIFLLILALHFSINDMFSMVLFAALVLSFALNNGALHRYCNKRVAQYLGKISYSIYLMQIFLQEPFSKGLRLPGVTGMGRGRLSIDFFPGLGFALLYLVLLVGISSITYYTIELPCRKWINRLGDRSGQHPVFVK
jgi:peptidoglycan/LPS O-acetylase OafA/YrhL